MSSPGGKAGCALDGTAPSASCDAPAIAPDKSTPTVDTAAPINDTRADDYAATVNIAAPLRETPAPTDDTQAPSIGAAAPIVIDEISPSTPLCELSREFKYGLWAAITNAGQKREIAVHKPHQTYVNPGLKLKSPDMFVHLPFDETQSALLKTAAKEAQSDTEKGTVKDGPTCHIWELDSSSFVLSNPAWPGFLDTILANISAPLHIKPKGVKLELQKLVLYGQGSSSGARQDSTKVPGKLATLSIWLPSAHSGGEVHISHGAQHQCFDMSEPDKIFDLNALAWYPDVEYEVKHVNEGCRLVLIYNIMGIGPGPELSASYFTEQIELVEDHLSEWNAREFATPYLLYYLNYRYRDADLRASCLQGRDKTAWKTLETICASKDLFLFLANMVKTESDGYCAEEGDHRYDDYDEDGFEIRSPREREHEHLDEDECGIIIDYLGMSDGSYVGSFEGMEMKVDMKDILGKPYGNREPEETEEEEFTDDLCKSEVNRYLDSAIVLVAKDKLSELLLDCATADALLHVAETELRSVGSGSVTNASTPKRQTAIDLMSSALEAHFSYKCSPRIAVLAWGLGDQPLFAKAIKASFVDGVPVESLTDSLLAETEQRAGRTVDWQEWLGQYVKSHSSLAVLVSSLQSFESRLQDSELRASFQTWRPAAERLAFEAGSQKLDQADFEYLMELASLRWKDEGATEGKSWIQDSFVPKIRMHGSTQLISLIIRELLQKDRQGILEGARSVAARLLGNENVLRSVRLGSIGPAPKFLGAPTEPFTKEMDRFMALVDELLQAELYAVVNKLLRLSLEQMEHDKVEHDKLNSYQYSSWRSWSSGPQPLAEQLIRRLTGVFEPTKMPPSAPARDLVAHLLREHVVLPLPSPPPPGPNGWEHPRRGCKKESCKHCAELDLFLVSATKQTHVFAKTAPTVREHIEQMLYEWGKGYQSFQCTHSSKGRCNLTVTKTGGEYRAALEKYAKEYDSKYAKVAGFRGEYMKALLGPKLYGELLMLDQLPKPNRNHKSRVPVMAEGKRKVADSQRDRVKRTKMS